MSSKAPNQNTSGATQPPPATPQPVDPWLPVRTRLELRVVRTGADGKKHFQGQQPDEVVRLVVRKHKWFLVRPALPFVGLLFAFLFVFSFSFAYPAFGTFWIIAEFGLVIGMVVAGVYFLWKDFVVWWFNVDIITDKRIISWHGFLTPTRKELTLDKVQQVSIIRDTPLQFTLNYGDLRIYLIGGDNYMKDVPNPKEIKDTIQGIANVIKAAKKPDEKPPTLANPLMEAVLQDLSKPKEVDKLPNPDDKYPPLHEDKELGPRRTFGGFLKIICDVRYAWGEQTVMYIQHSYLLLVQRLIIPALLVLILLPVAIYGSASGIISNTFGSLWWFLMIVAIFALLVRMAVTYINFIDDVYILTTNRVIDIERKLIFLFEAHTEAEYKNIRDIRVVIPNVFLHFLDVGDVYIETPGSTPDIVFKMVSHPFFLQDRIYQIKGYKEKADEAKKINDQKKELHLWFGKVLQVDEQTPQTMAGAPNLLKLGLVDAMQQAGTLGMQVVVWNEDPPKPSVPPGIIVYQNPPPGTVIKQGGEIQVVLSG